MKTKHILIASGTAAGFVLLVICIGIYGVYRKYSRFLNFDIPGELQQPRVVYGAGLLSKRTFCKDESVGRIDSLVYGEFKAGAGNLLAVVGEYGAVFTDGSGAKKQTIHFAPNIVRRWGLVTDQLRRSDVALVNPEGNCLCEFLVRNGTALGQQKAELLDEDGRTLWTYGEGDGRNSFLEDISAGDLDGDGRAEYAAAYLNGKGLVLLDHSLKEIWEKPDVRADHVEIADVLGDGAMEIIHTSGLSQIVVRDRNGDIVTQGDAGHYIGHFSLVCWPTKTSPLYAVDFGDGYIRIYDFRGFPVATYSAPLSNHLYRIHVTPVVLDWNKPPYFAAVAEFSAYERSVFYLYDGSGNLVYQEVMPEAFGSIAAIPSGDGLEAILLGGSEVLELKLSRVRVPQPSPDRGSVR